MAEKIKYGLSNVHIAKRTVTEGGVVSYGTPVALKGAVSLSMDAEGDESTFYADNMAYFSLFANNGYSGDLEIADVPDWFKKDFLGYAEATSGNLVETDALGSAFALMFQFETDEDARRVVLYNCTCSRPSEEYNTKEESIEPTTSTLEYNCAGEEIGDSGVHAYKAYAKKADTNYSNFFTASPVVPALKEA